MTPMEQRHILRLNTSVEAAAKTGEKQQKDGILQTVGKRTKQNYIIRERRGTACV